VQKLLPTYLGEGTELLEVIVTYLGRVIALVRASVDAPSGIDVLMIEPVAVM
jgi:hypothetical protein